MMMVLLFFFLIPFCTPQYGPVFSFTMMGSEVTFALGSEASSVLWGSHNDVLNAEDLYRNITTPVFGKGVAYDVPHKVSVLVTDRLCLCMDIAELPSFLLLIGFPLVPSAQVFSEQKQMAKEGLTKERFAVYTGIIEKEVEAYVERVSRVANSFFFYYT